MQTQTPTRARTQADLARLTGVSQVTIHKALTNQSGVSEQMRRHILQLAQQHGYRLNAGARAMRRGKQGSIAMLMSADSLGRSNLPKKLLHAAIETLESKGLQMVMAFMHDEQLSDESYVPRILTEWTSDGLLVNYNKQVPPRMLELLDRYGIPAIWINFKQDADSVYPDDFGAGQAATRRLIEMGHRRILYTTYTNRMDVMHFSEIDRRDGYIAAMTAAGLKPDVLDRYQLPDEYSHADRTAAIVQRLSAPDRPTATISYSIVSLSHIVSAAERLGLNIPGDLSAVTFEGERAYVAQEIATMIVPEDQIGRDAIEMLLRKIRSPREKIPARAVPFEFLPGRTLAPPR